MTTESSNGHDTDMGVADDCPFPGCSAAIRMVAANRQSFRVVDPEEAQRVVLDLLGAYYGEGMQIDRKAAVRRAKDFIVDCKVMARVNADLKAECTSTAIAAGAALEPKTK